MTSGVRGSTVLLCKSGSWPDNWGLLNHQTGGSYEGGEDQPHCARVIEDMRIRGMGDNAQKAPIQAIKDFAGLLRRSPDLATPDDLRAYQLYMTNSGVSPWIKALTASSHCAVRTHAGEHDTVPLKMSIKLHYSRITTLPNGPCSRCSNAASALSNA